MMAKATRNPALVKKISAMKKKHNKDQTWLRRYFLKMFTVVQPYIIVPIFIYSKEETVTDDHCDQENTRQSAVYNQRQSTGPWIAPMATTKHSSDLLICGLK